MISSLIDFELEEDDELDTKQFGELWTTYPVEEKRTFECSVHRIDKLAKRLSKSWSIRIIELIGQEFIAIETTKILIHIKLLPKNMFELTVKAQHAQDIKGFLITRHLQ